MPAIPSALATRYFLEISGKMMGPLSSFDGGYPVGDVVTEKIGPDRITKKHLAGLSYAPITFSLGPGVGHEVYDWIEVTFGKRSGRPLSGSIMRVDSNMNVVDQLEFIDALLTEVEFPAADGSSKQAADISLTIQPELVRTVKGSGKIGTVPKPGKRWIAANFKLTIPGVDCSRVAKVEALTLKQTVAKDAVGAGRKQVNVPGNLEIPDLVVSIAEMGAKDFQDWVQSFIVQGKNDAKSEKTATLEYLTPDMKSAIYTLKFSGVGIYKLVPDKSEGANDTIRRLTAYLYCEEADFSYDKTLA